MNDIEYRLRDAFRADADTISPQDVRPLPGPESPASRSRARRGRLARFAVPLVAAAAVAAVVIAVTLIPKPSAEPFASGAAPRFLVMVGGLPLGPHGRPQLVSVSTTTGRVTDTLLRLPNHGSAIAVAAFRSPGQFVVESVPRGSCATSFYQFRLTSTGHFADVRQLGLEFADYPNDGYYPQAFAASSDGPIIASAGTRCDSPAHHGVMISDVHVINVKTGKVTTWTQRHKSNDYGLRGLTVSANGRMVGLVSDVGLNDEHGGRFAPPEFGWAIPASSPSGPLARYWHNVTGTRTRLDQAMLSPDGKVLIASTVRRPPGPSYYLDLLINRYLTATGRLVTSQVAFRQIIGPEIISLDRSGRYLLIRRSPASPSQRPRAAVLDLATGHRRYIPGSVTLGAEGIAW